MGCCDVDGGRGKATGGASGSSAFNLFAVRMWVAFSACQQRYPASLCWRAPVACNLLYALGAAWLPCVCAGMPGWKVSVLTLAPTALPRHALPAAPSAKGAAKSADMEAKAAAGGGGGACKRQAGVPAGGGRG